jgi:hypothetical protein
LNTAQDNPDLRQTSLAALALMAQIVESAPDLEAVPLWEVMPIASDTLRTSRDITPETAAYLANRMTARWATQGQLSPTEEGIILRLDFIPARSSIFPFRYEKEDSPSSLNKHLNNAFKQFVDYLIARPLTNQRGNRLDLSYFKTLAQAVDKEYGWYVTADPGKAGDAVASLLQTDRSLARFLFNPSLYPSIDEGREQPPGVRY